MPDEPPDNIGDRRSAAIARVDEYITYIPAPGRLLPKTMERYHDRGFTMGWGVPEQRRRIHMTKTEKRPEVRVKPHSYQPTKANIDETIHIDSTPEDVIRAAFQQVRVVEDPDG